MQRFFAPGRTELAGNHTDHQLGRVLAASVDVGITARATRRRDRRVCIHSKGYRPFTVALDDLAVDPHAYGKPWALVRGMAVAILDAGGAVGGFEAWASSALKPGGGLSSSAAFEILVGRIFNALYNGGAFSPEQLARFGQQAENRHFGKPSTFVPFVASTTGTISIAGTQYTTSTLSFFTKSFNSFTKATASLGVLFIFQLPAIILLLAILNPLFF